MAGKPTTIVFFNASVILAGLGSPKGGSALLLKWSRQHKISAFISETVLDEITRQSVKVKVGPTVAAKRALESCQIIPAPAADKVSSWEKMVIDAGDAHVLASAKESKADYLVTLDKKNILVLRRKIRAFKIISPKELIEVLSKKSVQFNESIH